jgi:hypothetical protein
VDVVKQHHDDDDDDDDVRMGVRGSKNCFLVERFLEESVQNSEVNGQDA